MDALADLSAYLRRIGLDAAPPATVAGLATLHRAHAGAIPFENLDILLGREIRLDLPSLEAKLVAARRGGYCFEQNTLFSAALADLGFRVTPLAARVRLGGRTDGPRTHMLLSVRADGTMRPGEAPAETTAPEGDALLDLLRERFGLDFPPGTRFRPL